MYTCGIPFLTILVVSTYAVIALPITTKVVSLISAQHQLCDQVWHDSGYITILQFAPLFRTSHHNVTEIVLKVVLSTHNPNKNLLHDLFRWYKFYSGFYI